MSAHDEHVVSDQTGKEMALDGGFKHIFAER